MPISSSFNKIFGPVQQQELKKLCSDIRHAFTAHPHEAGETYFEHIAFTTEMSLRFAYVSIVVMLHGIFPFLLTREGSKQTEKIYRIMKSRVPKNPGDKVYSDYDI